MKFHRFLLAAVAMTMLSGLSQAQNNCSCGGGARIAPDTSIATLLGGKTVCASLGAEQWQEYHSGSTPAGGSLTDYKKGPSDPVDPSKAVGSWSTAGSGSNSRVIYNYGSGGTYQYEVCQDAGTIRFCGAIYGGRDISGVLMGGQVSCGGT